MSDQQVEKYDEFGDLSLSAEKDGASNLDEYGVWIKKKPSAEEQVIQDELKNDEGSESTVDEEQEVAFDFDGLADSDSSYEDAFEKELKETEVETASGESSDSSLNDIDMSNFFTDLEMSAESEETAKKEDEEALKMDLNFDTVDSYMKEENKDDFDSMLGDTEKTSDSELDDFLSDLNSSTPQVNQKNTNDVDQLNGQNIDLNIEVDENQDFLNIGQTTDAEESVILPTPISESTEESNSDKKEEESVIIKNTVVEPENIEEIREENRKVMGDEEDKKGVSGFSDIEALANELTSDISAVTSTFASKNGNSISVEGLDKITELLMEIVKELSSVKDEISTLKKTSHFVCDNDGDVNEKDVESEEATGFFKDEDTDEAIALTGDELNNILITADFTEEDEPSIAIGEETVDEDMGLCEDCSDDGKEKDEDSFSSEKTVDFDDITLENSKLDDFVIPEELDYSMLNNEDGGNTTSCEENVCTEGSDMSYLDEGEDGLSVDVPETQDISIEEHQEDISSQESGIDQDDTFCSNADSSQVLPSNIKSEVKSVLAYMDQLLESLPEDKMKEFAESEYFEMYRRLFNELGIS